MKTEIDFLFLYLQRRFQNNVITTLQRPSSDTAIPIIHPRQAVRRVVKSEDVLTLSHTGEREMTHHSPSLSWLWGVFI